MTSVVPSVLSRHLMSALLGPWTDSDNAATPEIPEKESKFIAKVVSMKVIEIKKENDAHRDF